MIDFPKTDTSLPSPLTKEPAKPDALTITEMLGLIVRGAARLRDTARYRAKRADRLEPVDSQMCEGVEALARSCAEFLEAVEEGRYKRVEEDTSEPAEEATPKPVPEAPLVPPSRPSWIDQLDESTTDPREAFFDLLGKQAIRIPLDRRLLKRVRIKALRSAVVVRDGHYCQYCGADMLESVNAMMATTRDHIVPVAKGGANSPENLVCCCQTCNLLKANVACQSLADAQSIVMILRGQRAEILRELRRRYR